MSQVCHLSVNVSEQENGLMESWQQQYEVVIAMQLWPVNV